MLAISGDNGDPMAMPSSWWYLSGPNWKCVACTQNIKISIWLSIGTYVCSLRGGYNSNLSLVNTVSMNGSICYGIHKMSEMKSYLLVGWFYLHESPQQVIGWVSTTDY